jgi:hypothetical protein
VPYPNFAAKFPTIIFLSFFRWKNPFLSEYLPLGNGYDINRSTNRFSVDPLDTKFRFVRGNFSPTKRLLEEELQGMRLATLFDRQLAGSMYSVPKKSARVLPVSPCENIPVRHWICRDVSTCI